MSDEFTEDELIEHFEWLGINKEQAEKILEYHKKPHITEDDLDEVIRLIFLYLGGKEEPNRIECHTGAFSWEEYEIISTAPELDEDIALIAVLATEWETFPDDSTVYTDFDWCVDNIIKELLEKVAKLLKVKKLTKYYGEPQELELQYRGRTYRVKYDVSFGSSMV